ncbi:jg23858 [Pararge aegeria aegeria]|uniref:Jg23858 protein n=1 Tax=Pararge aegeria aegeria TaxID=348720 RepID=A0A8S4RQS2_9NEOP|nr:jg23858 [Pararge aegeria aegeria]
MLSAKHVERLDGKENIKRKPNWRRPMGQRSEGVERKLLLTASDGHIFLTKLGLTHGLTQGFRALVVMMMTS